MSVPNLLKKFFQFANFSFSSNPRIMNLFSIKLITPCCWHWLRWCTHSCKATIGWHDLLFYIIRFFQSTGNQNFYYRNLIYLFCHNIKQSQSWWKNIIFIRSAIFNCIESIFGIPTGFPLSSTQYIKLHLLYYSKTLLFLFPVYHLILLWILYDYFLEHWSSSFYIIIN